MSQRKSPRKAKESASSATISVKIQPRASKNEIIRREGGELKIRLTAPPVDGAANEALVKLLSGELGVARSRVEIVSGQSSRDKIMRIDGLSSEEVERLLNIRDE